MRGKFVTIEGCEGAGKSAQLRLLTALFEKDGVPFLTTREPGGTPVAEKLRTVILDPENKTMTPECEVLLYAAARADHIANKIIPALEEGKLVLSDRFIDSSFAYQACARGLGFDFVEGANAFAARCMPDVTIFLDISPEDAFLRKGGADRGDRIEAEGMEFHKKVYEGYLAVAERFPDRVVRIDCGGTKFATHAKIVEELKKRGIPT